MATETNDAKLPAPGEPGVLYVVDLSGYIFRAYHAVPPLSSSKGEPTNAIYGVTAMLLKLVQQQQPAMLAVAMDSKSRGFRHEIFPVRELPDGTKTGYKATRPEAPADLAQQMTRIREVIDAYAVPVFQQDGFEADDLIASAVARGKAAGIRVVVVSADKDLLQLVSNDVVMYDTMRDKVYGPSATMEKMGVPPEKVRDLLALMGDTSDNVPGVPGVGPKTAAQLLLEYGDLDGVYAHLADIKRKALRESLEKAREEAYLSRKLVTLRDDLALEFDTSKLAYGGADQDKLRALFTEFEFTRLLAQLGPKQQAVVDASSYGVITTREALEACSREIRDAKQVALWCAIEGDDETRGNIVGIGLSWKPGAVYVPIAHRYLGVPEQLKIDVVVEVLGPILCDAGIAKQFADFKRERVALSQVKGEVRGASFDTMIASYLLDPERHGHSLQEIASSELRQELPTYAAFVEKHAFSDLDVERAKTYVARGAELVRVASETMLPQVEREGFAKLMREVELPLAEVLADMERTGVRLDVDYLATLSHQVDSELLSLDKRCKNLAGHDFNVGSPRQLETILFDELKLPVKKRTKTGRSTDHEVLEELALMHPLPEAILEQRALAKLKGTYLDALPKQVDRRDGRVHTKFKQAVAATGRLSSMDPNLQNIPIRTDLGRKIREAFVPREGWDMVSADYSQIELRVLAHLSHDEELVEAFRFHEDVHVRTAAAIFGVDREHVTRDMRGRAKTVNYAVIYGQTEFALGRNLKIDRKEAARYIEAFFEKYAGVKAFLDKVVEEARTTGAVRTILGRRRILPDMNSKNRGLRMAAERVAKNTPIQGSAADMMKLAMVRIGHDLHERKMQSRMLLTVHDELVFESPKDETDALRGLVKDRMENVMELDVPLVVDVGGGPTWGKAH